MGTKKDKEKNWTGGERFHASDQGPLVELRRKKRKDDEKKKEASTK